MRRIPLPLVVLSGVAALAAVASWLGAFPFWPAAAVLLLALLANGLLATVEDDLPGGFNNPDGTSTPRYVAIVRLALYVVAIVALVACVIAIVGNAIA